MTTRYLEGAIVLVAVTWVGVGIRNATQRSLPATIFKPPTPDSSMSGEGRLSWGLPLCIEHLDEGDLELIAGISSSRSEQIVAHRAEIIRTLRQRPSAGPPWRAFATVKGIGPVLGQSLADAVSLCAK